MWVGASSARDEIFSFKLKNINELKILCKGVWKERGCLAQGRGQQPVSEPVGEEHVSESNGNGKKHIQHVSWT